jgi:CheY-like chemotaxis protein
MCQSFLCNALSARGLHPILTVNGERAWSTLQEKDAPRLAILDFRLPGVNGIEICRRLRARHDPYYTYLLLLIPNSYLLDHLLARIRCRRLLAKPFNQDELTARLAIAGRILNIDDRLTEISGRWRTMLDTRCPSAWPLSTNTGLLKRTNTTFAYQMASRILSSYWDSHSTRYCERGPTSTACSTRSVGPNRSISRVPRSQSEVTHRSSLGSPSPLEQRSRLRAHHSGYSVKVRSPRH